MCILCRVYKFPPDRVVQESRVLVDIQLMRSIIQSGCLKKKGEERKTLAALDEELQRFDAHPELCLQPLFEMTVAFFSQL